LLFTFALAWSAAGADRRWIGDAFEDTWSAEDNWSPSGPPQDGDTLIFGNNASHQSNRNDLQNLRVQSIVFDGTSGGYSLRGNAVRLNADITAAHTSGFNNVRFDVQFSSGGGVFNVVRGGRLEIAGAVTLANGGTLIAFTFGTNLTISGPILGDGGLEKLGEHALFLSGTAANTYTGSTVIKGGTAYLGKTSGARAISSRVIVGDNTPLNCRLADLEGGQYPAAMEMFVGNRGRWALTNGATVSSLTLDRGKILGEGLLNLLCDVTNRGFAEIDCSLFLGNQSRIFHTEYVESDISQLVVNGHIIGPSGGANPPGLIKDGPGFLRLRNQNTYSGPTIIDHGEIYVEHGQALGTATGETRLKPFGDLVFNAFGPLTVSEPLVAEGGNVYFQCDVTLNGSVTLNHGCAFSGFNENRLDISGPIVGAQGLGIWGGTVRLSGAAPNTFAGDVEVFPGSAFASAAVLELAKPNDVPGVPTALILRGFDNRTAVLRNFQDNGARTISIYDGGVWDLNGYAATPASLKFYGAGIVDTGMRGTFPGILNFAGTGVNTQLQVIARGFAPSNYTALVQGRVDLHSGTNDVYIPGEVTLNLRAELRGLVLQKRGPGKLVLARDNRFLGKLLVRDGELVSEHDRALGGHTTISDGATLWLDSVFNFGSLTIAGRGFKGQGALAASGLAIFSSNVVLAAAATFNTPATNSFLSIIAPISGTGPLSKDGPGIAVFGGGAPNTFTGNMLVNEGTLELGKNDFVPAVPGDVVIGSGPPPGLPARVLCSGHDQIWNRITVNRGSLLDLNNRDEYSGDVTLNEGGDIQTGNGTLYLGTGVNLQVDPGTAGSGSSISGRIGLGPGTHRFRVGRVLGGGGLDLDVPATIVDMSPVAGIVKEGPGAMGLRASNSFTGSLIINDGNVSATHPLAFGSAAVGTFVNSNATLTLSGDSSGTFWVSHEPLTLNSTNSLALVSFGRSNTWSGNITLQRTAAINVASFDLLNLMGFFDCCPGIISGPGGIIKGGSGTLLISGFGPNDYAGSTLVNDGMLEAWRILSPALPGDVIVSGPNSALRTGRIPANTALASGASVTVKNGAQWTMNPTNRETLRELRGDGRVALGAGTTLTIDAEASHEFSGVLNGPGALDKRGPGQFLLSGQSPNYTGPATVFFGTLKVDGRIPNSPVTVKAGAQLRGDGVVGNVTAIEQDSVVQVDATFAEHLDRQAGDLAGANLTFGPGGIAGFELFGPSPTGGNDLLIANGPVNLGLARLSTEFNYPPREGDVITLIRKTSAGAINGTFAGLPEGATRKRGDVTVRASYVGGDGNDFTLTVTNLPLAFSSYRLAEGNGNQTVEPDECNLLHVSLLNRRTNQLVITNTSLRAITPNAAVTLASANYPTIPASTARENLTAFQFRTDRSLSCGQPVTFELVVGVANEGVFAVEFELVAGEGDDCNHPTGSCESCRVASGRFTTDAPTLVRFHNFIGGPSLCFPPKRCPETNTYLDNVAVPYLTHSFTNSTTNELCVTAQLRFGCPDAPTNALGAVAYLGTNDYHSPCVNYLGDTGADGTQPFSFRVPPATNFLILVSARATNVVCPGYTLELFGLPCPPPTLHVARDTAPDTVLLQWSTAYPDYRLQSTNALPASDSNAFSNGTATATIVNGNYTVTNSSLRPQQFFRLSK
jgi:autotransporter-associated beta strand protein